jgi:hypothetical protein
VKAASSSRLASRFASEQRGSDFAGHAQAFARNIARVQEFTIANSTAAAEITGANESAMVAVSDA